jgi:phenylacetate-CoA ligase
MNVAAQALPVSETPQPLILNSQPGQLTRKLKAVINDAVRNVPFYGDRVAEQIPDAGSLADILAHLRPTAKSELVATPAERLLNSRFNRAKLRVESTSGSSAEPFSLALDRSYLVKRNLRFLQALLDVGYRPGNRLMLVSSSSTKNRGNIGWHYQSIAQTPAALFEAFQHIKPQVLYGCVTPLRLLAEYAQKSGQALHRPKLVITTGELLHAGAKGRLSQAFAAPLADFYGSTEMGLVAWRRPDAGHYKIAERATLVELVPYSPDSGWHELVLTNLELRSMPMLRLQQGDLAEVEFIDGVPHIVGFQGREVDVLWHGENPVSPYVITSQFEAIPGLVRFQLTQRTRKRLEVTAECDKGCEISVSRRINSILQQSFGNDVEIDRTFVDRIAVAGLRKFLPIRSLVQG